MKLLPLSLALLLACLVAALHNVTIDDPDTSIKYFPLPRWDQDKFQPSPLDIDGFHTVSVDPSATATLTFTGVAVYYMSPKWPFQISVSISVDNGLGNRVDLRDYDSALAPNNSAETVQSQALWGWTSPQLTNESHTVVVSMGDDSTFVVVDGFNYTVLDPDDLSTTSPAPFSSTLPISSPALPTTVPASSVSSSAPSAYDTSSANLTPPSNRVTHNSVSVIAGSTVGGLVVLIGVVVLLIWVRRKSRPPQVRLHEFWD